MACRATSSSRLCRRTRRPRSKISSASTRIDSLRCMTDVDVPGEYARGLFTRLGDRDWLSVLEETPTALPALFDGVDDAAIRRPERAGKWSMIEVAHHLADGEMVVGLRLRMILAEDRPPIAA